MIGSSSYASTGVAEICKKAGVNKGSFYHFFESKEELAINALDAYISAPGKSIDGPGGIELSFDFQAAKNAVAGKAVTVTPENIELLFEDGFLQEQFYIQYMKKQTEIEKEKK